MSDPKLLACPFCGQSPKHETFGAEIGGGDTRKRFVIRCDTRGCVGPFAVEDGESGYRQGDLQTDAQALDKVVARWNSRVTV